MKGSLIIVAFFVAGVILARWDVLPQELLQQDFSMYVLYGLMFLVGISIGSDRKAWAALKGQQLRIVLVPLATIVGTLAGSIGVSFLLTDIRLTDCLAIGSGFGYYSLSSIFITEYRGAELGTIALTTNIIREIITLLGAAVLVRCFGKLAPICSGGATTMDTTLPVITRVCDYCDIPWVCSGFQCAFSGHFFCETLDYYLFVPIVEKGLDGRITLHLKPFFLFQQVENIASAFIGRPGRGISFFTSFEKIKKRPVFRDAF